MFAALLPMLFSCDSQKEVSEEEVSRVLQTLSSDEMMGRHSFSPEIHLAADFIASEYDKIGLSPLPDSSSFKQRFTIYSLEPREVSVIVNGSEIEDDYYFGIINSEAINWDNNEVPVFTISESDNYRSKFGEYVDDGQPSVIRVHHAHKKWFHKYRSYFTRSNHTMELDSTANDVFILTEKPIQNYSIRYTNNLKPIEMANIIGMIEGKRKDEIVLFSAHYDHIGVISPADQDSIANGANDNASGVTAVVELARYFESRPKPERTIYFIGFTAEETGGYGSKYLAKQMNAEDVVAMFNIEMIGKPALEGSNSAWITGFEFSSFGEILQNSVEDSVFTFYPDPYTTQNLFYRSDNTTFARLGVPAHTISTTPIDVDQDYHRTSDEFKSLNVPHIVNTINAIAIAAETIISGKKTPTRISSEAFDE